MLVVIVLALVAGFSGRYYVGTYKKTSLNAAARNLLLMGKYARMCAIEEVQTCHLCLDDVNGQFYLMAPVFDASSQTKKRTVVSNPYCRKKSLGSGIEFEMIDIKTVAGQAESEWDDSNRIMFFPDGSCDSAVVQIGNGRHSVTIVFSSAYSKITVYEGVADDIEGQMQVIDLDAAG
jgi:hypothetical protein